MVDRLSFFKPRRPNLLQIGQIRHQSTPLYLYIQNINLVCHSDLLWDELGRENGVYTPPNTKANGINPLHSTSTIALAFSNQGDQTYSK